MTMLHSELPLRPRPAAGEALLGYLLRVGSTNGYQSVQAIRQLFGLKSTLLHSINCHYRDVDALYDTLADWVRMSPDTLKAHFAQERSDCFDSNRAIQNIAFAEPNVCLACLREGSAILSDWRLAHVTHCAHHKVKLINRCPQCEAPLKWKPTLYSHCERCDTHWDAVSVPSGEVPMYQKVEETLSDSQTCVYRHHLYNVARMAMRFYDMQLADSQTFPTDIDERPMLFAYSYHCLVEPGFLQAQLDKRKAYWIKLGELQHLPERFFARLFQPVHETVPLLPENNGDLLTGFHISHFQTHRIIHPRKNLLEDNTSSHFQLDIGTLAKCLQRQISDITPLVSRGVLVSRNAPKMARDYWFDARDVEAMFARLHRLAKPIKKVEATLLSLNDAEQIIRRFKYTLADILKLVFEQRCAVYLKAGVAAFTLRDLWVDREMLFAELDVMFNTHPSQIKAYTLQQYLYANVDTVEQFIAFVQAKSSVGEGRNLLYVEQMKQFVAHYLPLNRWCRMRKLALTKVLNRLREANLEPVFEFGESRGFYIFEKTEKLNTVLSQIIHSGDFTTATV